MSRLGWHFLAALTSVLWLVSLLICHAVSFLVRCLDSVSDWADERAQRGGRRRALAEHLVNRLAPYIWGSAIAAAVFGIVWLAVDCIRDDLIWPVLVVAAVGCLFGELLHRDTSDTHV